MSSKIDFTPNENGFVSFNDIVDQYRANEAKAKSAEQAAADQPKTDDTSSESAAAAEPKDEVEVVEKGFFESLIDDAGDMAKGGIESAREGIDEAEKRLDGAIESGTEFARELDDKIETAKTEVADTVREISELAAQEGQRIQRDFEPAMESVDEIIEGDIENMVQMKQALEEADDRIAEGIGKSVARHFGEDTGEFAKATFDEKSVYEGAKYALFTRHFDSPAEIGELSSNPFVKAGIDLGLAITREVAPSLEKAANSPGAPLMMSNFLPPSFPAAGGHFYEHVVLPQINAGLEGAMAAADDPEAFHASLTVMSPENLTAKVEMLEPGQTAVMEIGGKFSIHDAVGGGVGLGKSIDIKRETDGTYLVTVKHEESGQAGVGVEAMGVGAKADVGVKQVETVSYRARTREAALVLLGVQGGLSMEEAASASDDISLHERSTSTSSGLSGDLLAGAGADIKVTEGYTDTDGDGHCDEPFTEIGNSADLKAVFHANLGNVFNADDSHPSIPHLGGGKNGWISPEAAERIEQMIAPEFGETGINFEVKGAITARMFGPSHLADHDESRLEFVASTLVRNGNDVVKLETSCTVEDPAALGRAIGVSPMALGVLVKTGRITPDELGAIATARGIQDSIILKTTVSHTHMKGPSVDVPSFKARDQIETETKLLELSTESISAHELMGRLKM